MRQSKGDDMLDGVENLFPWSMECLGRFLPGKPARPAGQKQHIGIGQGTLAVTPGHFLDDDCLTTAAIDATHGIQQKNQKAPKGNELETALGELIVSGGRLMAARTNRGGTFARTHRNLNTLMIGAETCMLINESRKAVTAVCSENTYSEVSGAGVFGLRGRPGLAATPSAEIRFGPVETPSRPRHRR